MSQVFEDRVFVEVYQTEAAEFDTDDAEIKECRELSDKMGLSGQNEIFNEAPEDIPFPKLSSAEKNVWESFCPHSCELEKYKETVIPARVLRVVDHCHQKQMFKGMVIWSESECNPDPVVLGYTHPEERSYDKSYYIVARWGEALASWPEIVKAARDKWIRKSVNSLEARMSKIKEDIACIEHKADQHFEGSWVHLND